MKDRSNAILALLTKHEKIEVAKLSEELGVSQVTIRKDLDKLMSMNLVIREHGYAMLNSPDDVAGRLAFHYEEKKKIAERAAELVGDGDTIMIESGSCCALLALALTETKKNVTIITNSAFIADYIRKKTDFQIILLGGIYQHDSQCMVGPMVRDGAANFNVKYFFVGADGFTARAGFTNKDQMRAQAVRDMAESAETVVVLTESPKLGAHGTVSMNLRGKKLTLITDQQASQEYLEILKEKGIDVVLA